MAPEWRKRHRARDLMYSYLTGPKPCVLPAAAGRMKSHPLLNLLNQAENCSRFWPGCAVTSVGPAVSQTEVRADAGSEIRLQQAACSRLFPCSHAAAVPAVESGLPWSHPFFWRWCCVDVAAPASAFDGLTTNPANEELCDSCETVSALMQAQK